MDTVQIDRVKLANDLDLLANSDSTVILFDTEQNLSLLEQELVWNVCLECLFLLLFYSLD